MPPSTLGYLSMTSTTRLAAPILAASRAALLGGAAPAALAQEARRAPAATDANAAANSADNTVKEVIVTARRRAENVQSVPVRLAVVTSETLDKTGAYNVGRLSQIQPSLQFYSQNPRNTSVNIRGL